MKSLQRRLLVAGLALLLLAACTAPVKPTPPVVPRAVPKIASVLGGGAPEDQGEAREIARGSLTDCIYKGGPKRMAITRWRRHAVLREALHYDAGRIETLEREGVLAPAARTAPPSGQ
jgi:hypothetical protein